MDQNQRLADENAFLETNCRQLAEFGPQQYTESQNRGAVVIDCRNATITRPVMYMPAATMQDFNLMNEQSSIGWQVREGIQTYDPQSQVFVIFLYNESASLYLLNVDDLLAGS